VSIVNLKNRRDIERKFAQDVAEKKAEVVFGFDPCGCSWESLAKDALVLHYLSLQECCEDCVECTVDSNITEVSSLPSYASVIDNGSNVTLNIGDTYTCTINDDSAMLLKTGQTVSFRTGDDGDTEKGRAVSFLTLANNNPFGNTNRFTDILGGQTYTVKIALDWSTYSQGKVLAYYYGDTTDRTWNNQIDAKLTSTIGGLTGWNLFNAKEAMNILNFSLLGNYTLNYAPFNFGAASGARYFFTSNSDSTNSVTLDQAGIALFITVSKALANKGMWTRYCNVNGTIIS
jgi:hypothetical protein